MSNRLANTNSPFLTICSVFCEIVMFTLVYAPFRLQRVLGCSQSNDTAVCMSFWN
jgi:hypothetical protein